MAKLHFASSNLTNIYQDQCALVVWKSAGLVVNRSHDTKCVSVEAYLLDALGSNRRFWIINSALPRSTPGLVLVALQEHARHTMTQTLAGSYRAIVVGDGPEQGNPLVHSIRVLSRIQGNTASYSTIDVARVGVDQVAGCGLRKQLALAGYSVIGAHARWATPAKSSASRGIFLVLLTLSFQVGHHEVVSVTAEEPAKFESFRNREVKFVLAKRATLDQTFKNLHLETPNSPTERPVPYQLGYATFAGNRFNVNENVMIPRPSTEVLVQRFKFIFNGKQNIRILDLGTGSGALLLTCLLFSPTYTGVGLDISSSALDVAVDNATALSLSDRASFLVGDFEQLDQHLGGQQFDAILCNPPYLSSPSEIDRPLRGWEPDIALYAGHDNLIAYRKLLRGLENSTVCHSSTVCLVETGKRVADNVKLMFDASSFDTEVHQDSHGLPRLLLLRKCQKFTSKR